MTVDHWLNNNEIDVDPIKPTIIFNLRLVLLIEMYN